MSSAPCLAVKILIICGATTTLLQCMAMGKAVAVSRVGAIREGYGFVDGVNVRWMEPGSPDSFTAAVDSLLEDEGARCRIGEQARRHAVDHHGWDRYVSGIEDALGEWLGNKEKGG